MATTNLGLQIINQSDYVSPTPINSNMEVLDALGKEYVTAQGISGGWTYRRWKSGIYECWRRYEIQTPAIEQVSPPGSTDVNLGYYWVKVNYPITFSDYPVVTATAGQDGTITTFIGYVEPRNKSICNFYVLGLAENKTLYTNIYAIGTVS